MSPELKALWIQKLTSGEYKQGQNFLHEADHYCCLGVLCEISGKGEWQDGDTIVSQFHFNKELESEFPSRDFLKEVGLSNHMASRLAKMNDSGKNFDEIAYVIDINVT